MLSLSERASITECYFQKSSTGSTTERNGLIFYRYLTLILDIETKGRNMALRQHRDAN